MLWKMKCLDCSLGILLTCYASIKRTVDHSPEDEFRVCVINEHFSSTVSIEECQMFHSSAITLKNRAQCCVGRRIFFVH